MVVGGESKVVDEKYTVTIFELQNNKLLGKIAEYKVVNIGEQLIDNRCIIPVKNKSIKTKEKEFNVLNLVGDYLACKEIVPFYEEFAKQQKEKGEEIFINKYLYQVHKNPFYFDYKFKDIPQYTSNYCYSFENIEKIVKNNKNHNLAYIEQIKSAMGLSFQYRISYNKTNDEREAYSTPTLNDVIDKNNLKMYKYSCSTIEDMIISVFHYLISNGYKIARCKVCGKYFATKSLKKEYCTRKSPLKGYENKTCYEAKKAMWEKLQLRKNKLKSRLAIHPVKLEDFIIVTWEYEDEIKENPTAVNLQKYSDFLFIESENIYKKYERVRT